MDIRDIQFPLMLPTSPAKRRLKVLAGQVLAAALPVTHRRALAGELPDRLTLVHRLLIAAQTDRCEQQGRLAELTPLHNWLWRSEQAVSFHTQAEARFKTWWMDNDRDVTQALSDLLAVAPDRFHTLREIGCGSGLVLADLAATYPQLATLIGLDLSAAQTALHARRFAADPRLTFVASDATQWLPAQARPGWICFTHAGVLEYFPPAVLRQLLLALAAVGDVAFALTEPIADDFDWATATESRTFTAEKTYSHPYPQLFRDAGWTVHHTDERRPSSRHLLMVASVAAADPVRRPS